MASNNATKRLNIRLTEEEHRGPGRAGWGLRAHHLRLRALTCVKISDTEARGIRRP